MNILSTPLVKIFFFHKHLIIYLKKNLNDGFQFLEKYKSDNIIDNKLFKDIMRLVIYPLYKIQKLQEKFYILKLNISPLDICIDLIEKKNLVKTQIIQHNYGCISIEDIEKIEKSVKSVIKDILNMNEKITILFKEINEVTKKLEKCP